MARRLGKGGLANATHALQCRQRNI